ncbi:NAD(P)-dependent oxidoreductase [Pilimelia anulata]|uniref:NAD(P)-dependent oxidoreductase n=1 Tax=Pilimelia anulata TaxID=53371 RepID=A0A8J3FD10_9ACTN|nr:SDR family oxidoreductase [Pilimelia anulata]GGJ94095.1 NAD(P)-dependent oxidoreductase [Pilimelia anulata]
MRVLVTGATGYIGGRLAPRLVAAGHAVRCLTRSPRRLADVPWAADVEVAEGDVLRPDTLGPALSGVDVAYYLVHSLGSADFEDEDRRGAAAFAAAARAAGVRRIVYLGGPAPTGGGSSAHLRSRDEVANILLASGVPTVVLRAAVILGSGSASFEMLRYLTERLPAMVTPRWVRNRIQPIAVRDVLHYLVAAAALPGDAHGDYDIGGPEVLTFASMMQRYARVAGLRPRVIVGVRALSPRLSAYWVGLVTPVPGKLAKPLVASLVHEAVCRDRRIAALIPPPGGGLTGFDAAIALALARTGAGEVETRWSSAAAPSDPLPTDPDWAGGSLYTDERSAPVAAPPERLWRVIEAVGGRTGWYSSPLAWSVRGWLDSLVGGVGLRRGRRDPHSLRLGEALDFWRVEELDRGRLLRLRAEMRLPGRAWLELAVAAGPAGTRYDQRAIFRPHGLAGHLYWWAVAPFHALVFGGMARNIARAADAADGPAAARPERAAARRRP